MFIFQKIKSFFTNTQPPLNNNNTPYNLLACPSLQVSQIQNIQDIIENTGRDIQVASIRQSSGECIQFFESIQFFFVR